MYFFARLKSIFMSDLAVMKKYRFEGKIFGDAVSYGFMGECLNFQKYLAAWERWEKIYAARGYRTVPLEEFVQYGAGYVGELQGWGERRAEGEALIFHAANYRRKYLGRLKPAVDISKKEIQIAEWQLPDGTEEE